MGKLQIPYKPQKHQLSVHDDPHRFRVVAAGRQCGKTTLALAEVSRAAILNPKGRSWYVAPTYRQAKSIAWDDAEDGIFGEFVEGPHAGKRKFLPESRIERVYRSELKIILKNGHVIEFKGAENKDKLRGAKLHFLVLDEFGHMDADVWDAILRPMLMRRGGKALFIGTPGLNGSPHFHDLYKIGQTNDPLFKSWLFFTKDNEYLPREDIEHAQKTLPHDIYKREFEADFTIAKGIIYDNFDQALHVIPSYEPKPHEIVIGSIDPGYDHPTAALLSAWDLKTPGGPTGRFFKEYYRKGALAPENAEAIRAMSRPYNVRYWVIDSAANKTDPSTGSKVFNDYRRVLGPVRLAPRWSGSVNFGNQEVKKLLQPHAETGLCRLYVTAELTETINEFLHYCWYKPKQLQYQTPKEKPRKYMDDCMDAVRNSVLIQPWLSGNATVRRYTRGVHSGYTGY